MGAKAKAAAQPKRGGKGAALLLDFAVEEEHEQHVLPLLATKAGAKRATNVADMRASLDAQVKELLKARLQCGALAPVPSSDNSKQEIQTGADQGAATEAIEELKALLVRVFVSCVVRVGH